MVMSMQNIYYINNNLFGNEIIYNKVNFNCCSEIPHSFKIQCPQVTVTVKVQYSKKYFYFCFLVFFRIRKQAG